MVNQAWTPRLENLRKVLCASSMTIEHSTTFVVNMQDTVEVGNSTEAIYAFYLSLDDRGRKNFVRLIFAVLAPEAAIGILTSAVLRHAQDEIMGGARTEAGKIIERMTAQATADRQSAAKELASAEAWRFERSTLIAEGEALRGTVESLRCQLENARANANSWAENYNMIDAHAEALERRMRKLAKIEKLAAAVAALDADDEDEA